MYNIITIQNKGEYSGELLNHLEKIEEAINNQEGFRLSVLLKQLELKYGLVLEANDTEKIC